MPPKPVDKTAKKQKFIKAVYELFSKFKQIAIIKIENVGSTQIQQVRRSIGQKGGFLVVGKNSLVKKAIQLRTEELPKDEAWAELKKFGAPMKEVKELLPLLTGKIGLVFTNEPVFELKPRIEANKVAASARAGTISPIDVIVPPGPTGMDPSQISFFHALQISTKINKGQIEIAKDVRVCTKGKKIGNSEVALLGKMNMKPFQYGVEVFACYDDGTILGADIVALKQSDIIGMFNKGVQNIAALSLQTNIPTELSVPHLIINSFKNLAAIGLNIGYEFKQLKSASSGSGPAQPKAAEKKEEAKPVKKEEKKEVKVEEPEENVDMGDLFGGDF